MNDKKKFMVVLLKSLTKFMPVYWNVLKLS